MKNVTVTMDEALLRKARIAAAEQGKSLSKFIAETMERRVGRELTHKDAIARFIAGPLMDLTDENGNAPTRDDIYDGPRLR
jgi:hypothetical protein